MKRVFSAFEARCHDSLNYPGKSNPIVFSFVPVFVPTFVPERNCSYYGEICIGQQERPRNKVPKCRHAREASASSLSSLLSCSFKTGKSLLRVITCSALVHGKNKVRTEHEGQRLPLFSVPGDYCVRFDVCHDRDIGRITFIKLARKQGSWQTHALSYNNTYSF